MIREVVIPEEIKESDCSVLQGVMANISNIKILKCNYKNNFNVASMEILVTEKAQILCCHDEMNNSRCFIRTGGMVAESRQAEGCDKHYIIGDVSKIYKKQPIFVVRPTDCEDAVVWVEMIKTVAETKKFLPIFVGELSNDCARECFEKYIEKNNNAISLVGKTPGLMSIVCLLQQSRLYIGPATAGMDGLANLLKIPVLAWWQQSTVIGDTTGGGIPYMWTNWKNPEADCRDMKAWLKEI